MLKLNDGRKVFGKGNSEVIALSKINLKIEKGEFLMIIGASGSGKSTLLNILSTIEHLDEGTLLFNEQDITNLNEKEKTIFRRKHIGFIFQQYHLLEHLTVRENILVGSYLNSETKNNIDEILSILKLEELGHRYPYELSGGQQQRVAIARALSKKPEILICDEPTGALDEATGKLVLGYLEEINNKFNTTIIMVTHSPGISQMGTKIVKMNSGKIIEELVNVNRVSANEVYWG